MKTVTNVREGTVRTITMTEYLDSSDLEDPARPGGEADPKPAPKRLDVQKRTFDELGRLIETRREKTLEGKLNVSVVTYEYTNSETPRSWTKRIESDTESDGTTKVTKTTSSIGANGGFTIDSYEDEKQVGRYQRICEKLTCTTIDFDLNEAGELIEDDRTVTTYFGGIGGLIESEKKTTGSSASILEATFADNGSFSGYTISGTQNSSFWGRQGKIDFTVKGTCVLAESNKITCTTTKTTEVDLTVVDVVEALYAVLTLDEKTILTPQPIRFDTTITDKGETKEYKILKNEYDDNYRLVKQTFSLLGNPEPDYNTYEYNGPNGIISKKTKHNSKGEIRETTVYTYN